VAEAAVEALEWIQRAEDGGSQAQVYRVVDDWRVGIKFAENPQGIRVLINEFIACRLAQCFDLPINVPVLVDVDARLLANCPPNFRSGVHCGLVRYPAATKVDVHSELLRKALNVGELHGVAIFEQLVRRGDGRQLLTYPTGTMTSGSAERRFAAFDYGWAFGGTPNWTAASLGSLDDPMLPAHYADGAPQAQMIDRLRSLAANDIETIVEALGPPRWGLSAEEGRAIVAVTLRRAESLVEQYERRYYPLIR
jgi:HipA-like protein